MSEDAQATNRAPSIPEVESLRYMSKDGKAGTLSLVVGGVHYLYPCSIERAFHFIASAAEAAAKRF